MNSKQKLTEKLLEQSSAMPARGRSNRNIVQFLAKIEEIKEALRNGWSMKAIWNDLHQDGLFLGGYCSFTLYVKKFIRSKTSVLANEGGISPSTVEAMATSQPMNRNEKSALSQGFHHDPVPPKPNTLF